MLGPEHSAVAALLDHYTVLLRNMERETEAEEGERLWVRRLWGRRLEDEESTKLMLASLTHKRYSDEAMP